MNLEKSMNFETKKQLFDYIVTNKRDILDMKKASLKTCDVVGFSSQSTDSSIISLKSEATKQEDNDEVINRTIVGNTYYWLDSHRDVHIDGCFSNSIKQRGAKRIAHLHDHIHELTAKVGVFNSVEEIEVSWAELGVNKIGTTTALVANSDIKKELNKQIFDMYKNNEIDQHSVGMYYVNISVAINDEEYKEEFAEWEKYIDRLGNKDEAEKIGYFYVIKEAKLAEISCVLNGSNVLTPVLDTKEEEITLAPSADRQDVNKKDELIKVLSQIYY